MLFSGKHLQYIRAFPSDHHVPPDFHEELQDVIARKKISPSDRFQELISSGGKKFHSIAKQVSGTESEFPACFCLSFRDVYCITTANSRIQFRKLYSSLKEQHEASEHEQM